MEINQIIPQPICSLFPIGKTYEGSSLGSSCELVLKRVFRGPDYTIGKLYYKGQYVCDTLEDTDRDKNHDGKLDYPEVKIYGKTAIPNGRYTVVLKHSPKFSPRYGGKPMPYIEGVTTHTGVLFHWGNRPEDTAGCILVGQNTVKGEVLNSRVTFDKFYSLLSNENNISFEII